MASTPAPPTTRPLASGGSSSSCGPPEAALGESDEIGAADDLRLRRDQVGAGYATVTPVASRALTLAARTEGMVLDPIYTARALAGLIAAIADGSIRRGEPTVLLHGGGLPSVFAHDPDTLIAGAE